MHPPTLNTVPGDVMDKVCDFLEEDEDKHLAAKNLCALALTSRSLLPIARLHLYADPLPKCIASTASNLVTTLAADDKAFGRLVRSLQNLPRAIVRLEALRKTETEASDDESESGDTESDSAEARSWFFAMLRTCPHLNEVEVTFDDSEELDEILATLTSSLPTLTKVKLQGMSVALVLELAQKLALNSLEELHIGHLTSVLANAVDPPLALSLKTLTLELPRHRFKNLLQLFPNQPSALQSLSITSKSPSAAALLRLVRLAGARLIHFRVATSKTTTAPPFATYGLESRQTIVPLDVFSLLPLVRTLTLTGFRALSPKRVEALSCTSSRLVELSVKSSLGFRTSTAMRMKDGRLALPATTSRLPLRKPS